MLFLLLSMYLKTTHQTTSMSPRVVSGTGLIVRLTSLGRACTAAPSQLRRRHAIAPLPRQGTRDFMNVNSGKVEVTENLWM